MRITTRVLPVTPSSTPGLGKTYSGAARFARTGGVTARSVEGPCIHVGVCVWVCLRDRESASVCVCVCAYVCAYVCVRE